MVLVYEHSIVAIVSKYTQLFEVSLGFEVSKLYIFLAIYICRDHACINVILDGCSDQSKVQVLHFVAEPLFREVNFFRGENMLVEMLMTRGENLHSIFYFVSIEAHK